MSFNLAALAWRNIRTRQARSWLTILGVLIGVTAIVTLISIGTGVESAVLRQFEDVGLDVVLLIPKETATRPSSHPTADVKPDDQLDQLGGEGFGPVAVPLDTIAGGAEEQPPLDGSRTLDTARLRRDVPEVTEVGQIATRVFSLSAGKLAGLVRVMVPSLDLIARFPGLLGGFEMAQGRSFDPDANQVVLGARTAIETGVNIGETITIGGVDFIVVGILEPSAESHAGVGGDLVSGEGAEAFQSLATTDDAVFVSYERALALWPDATMSSIVAIRIRTGISVTDTIVKINQAVERQGISMTPVSTQALADNVQRTLGMVKIVLASIAAISLLVGAVGMMNTMYTSVLERTREIGILKSIGAKDRQVLSLFLIDSGLMGLVGGILGLILGVGASFLGTILLGDLIGVTTFLPVFAPWLVFGVVGLSFVLGSLAGVWPAWHAARLDPVSSLASD